MKSTAEIVVETLLYYNLKNRGYNNADEHCTYLDKSSGNKCAVGRCILDSEIEKVSNYEAKCIEAEQSSPTVFGLVDYFKDLDSILIPEYRGQNDDFWTSLQDIHDGILFWNDNGFILSQENLNTIYREFGSEVGEAVKIAFAEKIA